MHLVLAFLCWASAFTIIYTYVAYPFVVWILATTKQALATETTLPEMGLPRLTFIIAAYNEAPVIAAKIENSLKLDYPAGLLSVLMVTDGSTDDTTAIVKRYPDITLMHLPERKGKLAAINRAMAAVDTPLVVFSDANSLLNKDALMRLTTHFADPLVGGVAGEKRVLPVDSTAGAGEGWYWRYESLLKRLDSRLYTTVGAAGELFCMRTSLYMPLPENTIIEDFVQSMNICVQGYVVRYEPGAWAEEKASSTLQDETERKIRIAAGGFQAIGMLRALLNPFRYPLVSFQWISHRVLRWAACPPALVVLYIATLAASIQGMGNVYGWMLGLQTAAYAAALVGWLREKSGRSGGGFHFPFYFVFMHLCVFAGFWRFIRGKQTGIWQKASRS